MEAPSDREAELGVIGCCLLGGAETTCSAMDVLPAGSFSEEDCRTGFELIGRLLADGQHINESALRDSWRKNSKAPFPVALSEAQDDVPSAANLDYYSARVLDIATRRRLFWAAHDVFTGVQDKGRTVQECLSAAEAKLFDSAPNLPKAHDAKSCFGLMAEDMELRMALQGARSGISTGLMDLDTMLDGLQQGEQTIVAARPSMGKTAFGLTVLERACIQDEIPTLFVTLEMGIRSLMRRLASMHCKVPMRHLRRGTLNQDDVDNLACFARERRKSPMFIIDAVNGATDTELASAIRRAVRLHGIKLVIVDYLQKIRPSTKHEKKTYEVAQASGTLKNVADKCAVALLTLAQLNRESDKGGAIPRLCDLAESSQIERDADVVALLHRDKSDNKGTESGHMRLIIAKNRDGELGCVHLGFLGEYCHFVNHSRQQS